MIFLDTNILVYAADDTDPVKQRIARNLVNLSDGQIYCGMRAVNPFNVA